jgi:transcriptional regulator GlxA family with amidase domain
MINVGIFIFENVEVLDFAGPYEVFTTASRVSQRNSQPESFTVFTISKAGATIQARAGLRVYPDYHFGNHPPIDLLIIPGGVVTKELDEPEVIQWIQAITAQSQLTASVCTGAFLLAQAGLLEGKSATTHWEDVADLRGMFGSIEVVEGQRWVDEGVVITSAGISAGIDMSLHLVDRLAGRDLALKTARQMEFDWTENS